MVECGLHDTSKQIHIANDQTERCTIHRLPAYREHNTCFSYLSNVLCL